MPEVSSLTSEYIIARAEECYALGLISLERLAYVTGQARTVPGYCPIIDLPLSHEIDQERALRKRAARHGRLRRALIACARRVAT